MKTEIVQTLTSNLKKVERRLVSAEKKALKEPDGLGNPNEE